MMQHSLREAFHSGAQALGKPLCKRLCGRVYPIDELARLARLLKPASILDIGAHVGDVTLTLAKAIGDVPIHAFEPAPDTARLLRQNVDGQKRISVHEVAISAATGEEDLFINRSSQTNSLHDNDVGNIAYLGDPTAHVGSVRVRTQALDDWMAMHASPGPIVIKADVQGGELQLIQGGRRTLRHSTAVIMTEVSLMPLYKGAGDLFQIQAALAELGFCLLDIFRTYRNAAGLAMWADAMWIHEDYVGRLDQG